LGEQRRAIRFCEILATGRSFDLNGDSSTGDCWENAGIWK
jgi:hypothetical protein